MTRPSSSRHVPPASGSTVIAMLLIIFAFTARPVSGAGVTVITHGLNSDVDTWIIPMADRFTSHPMFPGTQLSCYEFSVTEVSGQLTVTPTFLGGTDPALSDSGEILIKLKWSAVDGFFQSSTPEVAHAAVEALTSTDLIPSLSGRALAELPLHLIGHSRGGSVVTEMARLFGAKGIWVDHVTTLDPRPVNSLGLNDADTTTYVNVLYADNFWQSLGNGLTVPNGKPVFGAYNRQLTALGGGYDSSHSDTHLWYHGTIELTTPATDTQATLSPTERATWWTSPESAGITAGFQYSRIGGGDRLSNLEPVGAGNGRINDGFNRHWDLGGGLASNRDPLPANSGLWPNVILCGRPTTGPVTAGAPFDWALYHQSGPGTAGNIEITTFLDLDFNPWTGNEIEIDQRNLANTGTAAVAFNTPAIVADPAQVTPGSYAVYTQIHDGLRTRYLYAPGLLTVIPPDAPTIDPDSIAISGGLMSFDVLGSAGQQVAVMASENLTEWEEIATHIFTSGSSPWQFTDTDTALYVRRFYQLELIP